MFASSQEHRPGDKRCLLTQVSSQRTLYISERLTLPSHAFNPLGTFVWPQPESRDPMENG